ncbi:MAG: sulfite exporter TauE/SafE family protein [Nitrospirota bacterium]
MIWQAALTVAAGVPIGLQLGATGTGGALLAVPMMVYIAGIPVQQAAGMSLVIVAASALLGVWEYGRIGQIKAKAALAFSWTGMIGSWAGAYAHKLVRGEVLLIGFGVMLLVARALMVQYGGLGSLPEGEKPCAAAFPRTCWVKVAAIGFAVGAVNGFFGVGGGFMIVPTLVLVLGFAPRMAVGTSLTIIALISIGGILGHLQFGALDPRSTALVITGSAAGILLGARLGQPVSPKAMSATAATITVGLALWLITVNTIKLLSASL